MMSLRAPNVIINDSTLRDGEQAPGVAFSAAERLEIAKKLDAAGVDEIEAGVPAIGLDEVASIRAIREAASRAEVVAWCRMTEEDVDAALECGVSRVNLSAPVSDIQMSVKLRCDRAATLSRIERVVGYAREKGLKVAVGGEDSSRAEFQFLVQALRVAERSGAHRFRFADTLGVLDPLRTHAIFRALRRETQMELEFHGHDDLGLATANTLAAIQGGADSASVCVLGLGERAGNAALEEVVIALERVLGLRTNVNAHCLHGLAEAIALAARRQIPRAKSVVGADVFTHESGIHVSALLRDPTSYEALTPESLGRERKIVLGKHSGLSSVMSALHGLGFKVEESEGRALLAQVRAHAMATKSTVDARQLQEWCAQRAAIKEGDQHVGV